MMNDDEGRRLREERDHAVWRMSQSYRTDHPALTQDHVKNAKLFATRVDLVEALRPQMQHGRIAELGVATGDFSKLLCQVLRPSEFVGFDLFDMHKSPSHWGIPIETLLQGMTHKDYYKHNLREFSSVLKVEEGNGVEKLAAYPDDYFDIIYIDAFHTYEAVVQDAAVSVKKVRPGGILFFNDYIFWSHGDHTPYGVVQVCNDLIVNHGYEVLGFALQQQMYCDMAIRRPR